MMKKQLFLFLMILLPMATWADSSGTCGDNLTWTYVEATQTLTISGSGAMNNYNYYNHSPWYSFRKNITRIEIKKGVTSIGDYTFENSSGLRTVTIPNSVTSIGNSAFPSCYSLDNVTIPNSVTSIGKSAFLGCFLLKSVTIPNTLVSIGDEAFRGCMALTSIKVESGNTKYDSRDNCNAIIEKASKILILGCRNTVIPNSVSSIGAGAFWGCSGLTSINIPNSVTSIGINAFNQCEGLTSVTIPNSVTNIGGCAFSGCKSLTSLTLPNSVTSIDENTFAGCSSLTSIKVESGNTRYDSRNNCNAIIETSTNKLIRGCQNTIIPNSVTSIGSGAFSSCSGLTSVIIPKSVTNIGDYAFSGCGNLRNVTVEMTTPVNIDEYTFTNRKNATLYVPDGCKATYMAANYWKEFKEIIEPNSGKCGDNLTWNYGEATNTLTISGSGAMYDYNSTNVTPWYNYRENIKKTVINGGVTSIGNSAFSSSSGLTSVTIPNSVTSIGNSAFANCSCLTSVTIPNGVTSIGNSAFLSCSGLTSVTIPNGVTSIEKSAFQNCSGLTSVTIGNNVTSIGDYAFYGCSNLKSFTIPNSVTSIGGYAFYNCSKLTSVTISNSVTSIGVYTFYGCSGLTSVIIPNRVTSIGGYAFYKCSGLTSITIPKSATSISGTAFRYCYGLTSIKVEAGNNKYDSRNNCNALIEISTNKLILGCKNTIIPNSVTNIDAWAFGYCKDLLYITIPNSVTSIGEGAFYGCSKLTNVTVGNKTPIAIGSNTFTERKYATLYVPYGCKSSYAAANYWKEFKEIVEVGEVTDISQMNNAIYVEPASGRVGDYVSIKICMKNANAATSYGFELVLPQGLSIATTSEGDFDAAVTMSTRHKGHTLTTNKLANNTYKVGVASLSGKALTDNDGLVLTIKAHVADNMAVGDYPILIQNPLIVNTDGTKPAVQNTQSKITIEDYTKGDVDGDGVVDLADAVLVINHYVGKPVSNFIEKAADVDGDGVVDLADAVRIINFYVGKVQSLAPSRELNGLDPQ